EIGAMTAMDNTDLPGTLHGAAAAAYASHRGTSNEIHPIRHRLSSDPWVHRASCVCPA
ncbi:MAG: hypothetical protein RI986_648, partial [Planctomycetota bacterium]